MGPASGPAMGVKGQSSAILLAKAQLAKSLDQAGVERLWTSVLQTKDHIRVSSDFLTDSPNTTQEFPLCTCGCGGYKSSSSPASVLTETLISSPEYVLAPRVFTPITPA